MKTNKMMMQEFLNGNRVRLNINIPRELKEEIVLVAKKLNCSQSLIVVEILQLALENR